MLRPSTLALSLVLAAPAAAQQLPALPRASAEAAIGYAGFLDESLIDHAVYVAIVRYRVSRHISLGPELVYMRGPGFDRDVFLTGNATFDFLVAPQGWRRGTVNPFAVVGAGVMQHSNRYGGQVSSSVSGAFTGGGGLRVWITDRIYALAEYRAGWEPHVRASGGVGAAW